MGQFSTESTPLEKSEDSQKDAGIYDNVKRIRFSDGKVRFQDGAIIITDETNTDRVIIGFYKDGF